MYVLYMYIAIDIMYMCVMYMMCVLVFVLHVSSLVWSIW